MKTQAARHATAALAATLALAAPALGEDRPVLNVYTYDSFVSDWGPGPAIEPAFEAVCGCDLVLLGAGDGAALLSRIRLEGARSEADVVLGLDTALMAEAAATGLFAPHGVTHGGLDIPGGWSDATFLPYDWGAFAFVYDRTRVGAPPESFAELLESDLTLLIQDPRSSTPGLGLLLWMQHVYGEGAPEAFAALAERVVTVTPGWSEAYGLFLEGEADMVLSYTTSPAYHAIAEADPSKGFAAFAEGHYLQIEIAGRLAASDQPELATAFLDFMLGEAFQAAIPTTNWMFPAVTPAAGLPEGFPAAPETARHFDAEAAREAREAALAAWLAAFSG